MDAIWVDKLPLNRSEDVLVDNHATCAHSRKQEFIIFHAQLQLRPSAKLFFLWRIGPHLAPAKFE